MWGFRQSTLLSVPDVVNRWLKSNRADMLWCARAEPARRPARQTERASLRIMTLLRGFRLRRKLPTVCDTVTDTSGFPEQGFRGPLDTHWGPMVYRGG